MDKYEYLTDENLGDNSRLVERDKFQYFLLGKICNEGLKLGDLGDLGVVMSIYNLIK